MHSLRCLSACALLSLVLTACGGGSSPADTDHCKSPSKVCGGTCVDPRTDEANCGSCGHACAAGEVCADGTCGATCGPDLTRCTGTDGTDHCADTQVDPADCGACGNACTVPANAVGTCAGGTCGFLCAGRFADCNGTAADGCEIDLGTDPDNCGACGHVCPAGPGEVGTCTQGVCSTACAPGFADCNHAPSDGCEVNLATDAGNCGACGNACTGTGGPNQSPVCDAGQCGIGCDPGFADCNGQAADGCETPLSTLTDCTACGDACATGANGAPVCEASGCGFTCDTGYLDCNSDVTDGCEVDGQTDVQNCGSCGNACAAEANTTAPTCTGGACVLSCAAGYADCDADYSTGCEVDLNTDAANCGSCGNPCTGGDVCSAGTCVPPPAGTLDQSFPRDYTNPNRNGIGGSAYQTYTAGLTGSLGQVAYWNGVDANCMTYTLDVYDGAGTGGTLLASLPAVQACGQTPGLFHVPLSVSIPQTAGQTYTLSFTAVGANQSIAAMGGDLYANGCSNAVGFPCPGNSPYDLNFQTWVR